MTRSPYHHLLHIRSVTVHVGKHTSLLSIWAITFLLCLCSAFQGCRRSSKTQRLSVYSASSLTEAFQDLKRIFESRHPRSSVQLHFAGSQILRLQIEQGASADVFASANSTHLQSLVRTKHLRVGRVFAHNHLALVSPKAQPISTLQASKQVKRLVVGTAHVPLGRYTHLAMQHIARLHGPSLRDSLLSHIVSRENNARLVLAKVVLGEADAAFVYRSDALAFQKKLHTLALPQSLQPDINYTIGQHRRTRHPRLAQAWIALLLSTKGQQVLQRRGFVAP